MNKVCLAYVILEIRMGAPFEEAQQAYRDLVRVWHPDRFSHDPHLQQKANEKLKKINEAYSLLHSSHMIFTKLNASRNETSRNMSSRTGAGRNLLKDYFIPSDIRDTAEEVENTHILKALLAANLLISRTEFDGVMKKYIVQERLCKDITEGPHKDYSKSAGFLRMLQQNKLLLTEEDVIRYSKKRPSDLDYMEKEKHGKKYTNRLRELLPKYFIRRLKYHVSYEEYIETAKRIKKTIGAQGNRLGGTIRKMLASFRHGTR